MEDDGKRERKKNTDSGGSDRHELKSTAQTNKKETRTHHVDESI
jgi:hypothetical protein